MKRFALGLTRIEGFSRAFAIIDPRAMGDVARQRTEPPSPFSSWLISVPDATRAAATVEAR